MKFVLHRNPENRNQKIPFPAMQMAELADAEQLTMLTPSCLIGARPFTFTSGIGPMHLAPVGQELKQSPQIW